MLFKLLELGVLDVYKLLNRYYKDLDLLLEEYIVLLELFSNYDKNENSINIEKLHLKTNLTSIKVSECVNNLLVKGFLQIEIDFKNGKNKEVYTLEPCLNKIEDLLNNKNINTDISFLQKVNQVLEELLNRSLTANEYDIIKCWDDEDNVFKAIEEAKMNNIKNVNYIDKLVISNKKFKENDNIDKNTDLYRSLEALRDEIKR